MGTYFEQAVVRQYPEFPVRHGALDWEQYLPPLSADLRQIVGSTQRRGRSRGGMTFLDRILDGIAKRPEQVVIQEVRDGKLRTATGAEFLRMVAAGAAVFFHARAEAGGDRCALIAANSIRWAAADLAMMAEGLIVVPLYVRQDPSELVTMLRDSTPARVVCRTRGWRRN